MITAFMTDAQLDTQYDQAMTSRDTARSVELADAIVMRITSPLGFIGSLVGGSSDFPLYEKWTKFGAGEAARSSVSQRAGEVTGAVASAIGSVTAPLIVLGLIGAYIIYKVKQ